MKLKQASMKLKQAFKKVVRGLPCHLTVGEVRPFGFSVFSVGITAALRLAPVRCHIIKRLFLAIWRSSGRKATDQGRGGREGDWYMLKVPHCQVVDPKC